MDIVDTPDAVIAEVGTDDPIVAGERTGVRARRLRAARRAARFDGDDGEVAIARDRGGVREHVGIANCLDVEEHEAHIGVVHDSECQLRERDVGVVAGRVRVADPEVAAAEQAVRHHAHHAALADDRHRAVGRRRLDEHRREARDGAGAEVGQTLRVGSDQPHAGGTSLGHHRRFGHLAGRDSAFRRNPMP